MNPTCGNTHFSAKPEAITVRETRRGVVKNTSTVNTLDELLGGGEILSDYGLRVTARTILA